MSAPTAPQAPHASQPTTSPTSNFSRPTTANANANANQNVNTNPPTHTQPVTTPAPTTTSQPTEDTPTYNDTLNANDRYWKFKFGLKAILILTGFIGIGCFGWLMSTAPIGSYSAYDEFGYYWLLWPSILTWSVSIAWCLLCIVLFLVRKRAVHPGVQVTINLFLWLGFLVTSLLALTAVFDLIYSSEWGQGGYARVGSDGGYVLASNGTWVWEQDTSVINIPRDCTRGTSTADVEFSNCEEQDKWVNEVLSQRQRRYDVTLTGVVCQWMGFVVYFVLFVWACVATHKHRKAKVSKDAEKMAADIVQKMIGSGAVVPPPGQAHVRPVVGHGQGPVGYYPVPVQHQQQPWPMQQGGMQQGGMQHGGMQQQGQMMPGQQPMGQQAAVGAAGPSNEMGKGVRYA